MKHMKVVFTIMLALLLVTSMVFAAGARDSAKDGIVRLRMEQFSGSEASPSGQALKQMIALFEQANPNIKVDLQTIGYDDYFTQLQSKVVGANAADVFELNYENFITYASEGALEDITNYIGDTSGYNTTALDAFKYGGRQLGVPNSFSNVVLFYNKELFDKANVAYPADDWTWKDIEVASKKIMALGSGIWGFLRPYSFHEFYKGVAQNNGSLTNEDGTAFRVNSPQNIEAASLMAGWQNESKIMPTQADMAGMGEWDIFKSGRLGMLVTGIWAFGDFTENCPFAWDIAIEPGNVKKATHFFSNAYVVSETSKYPQEAAKLAAFLSGSREATKLRVEASWELPPVTYPEILAQYLSITPPDNRKAVFDSLDYLVTPVVSTQQAEMMAIIEKYLGQILSGTSAKTALDACQRELESKIRL